MTEEVQAQAPVENVESEPTQLTINDLAIIRNIIDAASSRAAFKPDEMEVVGKIYNKLGLFLKAAQDAITKQSSAEEGEEEIDG